MFQIEQATEQFVRTRLPEFIELLRDAVDHGASVGFLPPLSDEAGRQYWLDIMGHLKTNKKVLLAALADARVVGTIQLTLSDKANARHRAEVEKLIVHTNYRQRGIGKALLQQVDDLARSLHLTLLVLDTRRGDTAEQIYERHGYTRVGVIPKYARSADGTLADTVLFYRLLDE